MSPLVSIATNDEARGQRLLTPWLDWCGICNCTRRQAIDMPNPGHRHRWMHEAEIDVAESTPEERLA